MPDIVGATPSSGDQPVVAADAQAPSAADQSASEDTEYAKLLSRIAGLDAKVTSLTQTSRSAEEARLAAERKLAEYEQGKVNADEALRAQLAAKDAELEAIRKEAAVTRVAATYPETYSVFGNAVFGMTPDQLAEAEARFAGTPGAGARTPGANPQRPSAPVAKDPSEMTLEELRKAVKDAPESVWGQSWSGKPIREW